MNIPKLIKNVRQSILNDQINIALNLLLDFFAGNENLDEVIIQSARYSELKRQIEWMSINRNEADMTKNKIRSGILQLVREVEEELDENMLETLKFADAPMKAVQDRVSQIKKTFGITNRKIVYQTIETARNEVRKMYETEKKWESAMLCLYTSRSVISNVDKENIFGRYMNDAFLFSTVRPVFISNLISAFKQPQNDRGVLMLFPFLFELKKLVSLYTSITQDNAENIIFSHNLAFERLRLIMKGLDILEKDWDKENTQQVIEVAKNIESLNFKTTELPNDPSIYSAEFLLLLASEKFILFNAQTASPNILRNMKALISQEERLIQNNPYEVSWKLQHLLEEGILESS